MKDFTKDVVNGIKNSDRKYKHDNLTTTECPTCGKFMIKVKTKMVRCLCAKIHLVRRKECTAQTNARCPNCKKKLTLFGKGKEAVYRCVCGHSETQAHMDQRMKSKSSGKVSQRNEKVYE